MAYAVRGRNLVMVWLLESDERLSCLASDDDQDATNFTARVLEDTLNTSGKDAARAPGRGDWMPYSLEGRDA